MKPIHRRDVLRMITAGAAEAILHTFGKNNTLAEPIRSRIDRGECVPPELRHRLGKRWSAFEEDLHYSLLEHKTEGPGLHGYLEGSISNMTGMARRALLVTREKQPEKIHSMVAGIHVSGYLHGIDPNLLAAIAHVESRFSSNEISPRGAMGLMQITLNSAVSELNPSHLNWRIMERILKQKARRFPGVEFLGAQRHVNLYWKGGWKTDREGAKLIIEHDLFNCMLAARTLIFKYRGRSIHEPDWSDANPIAVKNMLRDYQGSEKRGGIYARYVYSLYRNVYGKEKMRVA